jgi:hypothetical protein
VYPKYCPEHRNEYKRIRHLREIGREDLIEEMLRESENAELEPDAIPDDVVEPIAELG